MKTSEFVQKLMALTWVTVSESNGLDDNPAVDIVGIPYGGFIVRVPTNATTWLSVVKKGSPTNFSTFQQEGLSNLISEYLATPVDERQEEKKYTVRVAPGKFGLLNYNDGTGVFMVDDILEDGAWATRFTHGKIEDFKKRNDLAIDWDKAIIEPAEDDEDEN
ncbi:hypothetical protein [Limosilactobacillus sp.]|uniref:hypothetical protein n=1 Tax=Limosilactobacillus sp. TaxID=2773925 RepID=UPI003F12C149